MTTHLPFTFDRSQHQTLSSFVGKKKKIERDFQQNVDFNKTKDFY